MVTDAGFPFHTIATSKKQIKEEKKRKNNRRESLPRSDRRGGGKKKRAKNKSKDPPYGDIYMCKCTVYNGGSLPDIILLLTLMRLTLENPTEFKFESANQCSLVNVSKHSLGGQRGFSESF